MAEHPTDYSYYFGKLQGLPMMAYVDTPMPGFYRDRDGTPVAFFPNQTKVAGAAFDVPTTGGDIVGVRFDREKAGGPMRRRDLSDDQSARLWNWVCGTPVKESDWRRVVAGGEWHDEAPGLGHNRPEMEETVEQRAERLIGLANDWLKRHPEPLVTKDEADQAAHYITELRRTVGDLQDRERDETKPYKDFIAQIRLRFAGSIDALTGAGIKVKAKTEEYLKRQRELAAAEAKRQAEAAAQAAAKAAQGGPAPVPDKAPAPREAPRRAGARGKAVVLRKVYSAEIVDYAAALAACAEHTAVKDAVQQIANERARSSMVRRQEPDMTILLPGTQLVTEERL
jgi:hypothetical protein